MLIPYWIQRADMSSTDHGPVDTNQAVNDFLNYDWDAEQRLFDELDKRHEDNCPAGFGFSADDGRRLHVCLDGTDRFFFFYDYRSKVLGLIPHGKSVSSEKMSTAEAAEAIRRFFDGDHEWLVHTCGR